MDMNTASSSVVYSRAQQQGSKGSDVKIAPTSRDNLSATQAKTTAESSNIAAKPQTTSKADTYTPSSDNRNSASENDTSKGPLVYSLKTLRQSSDSSNLSISSNTDTATVQPTATLLTANASSASGSSHGGANVDPGDIASPAAATKMIQDLKAAGGGTLRIQMTHDQINNAKEMDKLHALLDEGDKQGLRVQFTYRDNSNGGGGTVLSGDKLNQAADDITHVVKSYGNRPSFVLDTFNEGGQSATQGWADMESTLIKAARNAGYNGSIVVEDSNWGGGLTAGPESGLVKYANQLKSANGSGKPGLIGSIHEYANDADASARLGSEIKALQDAGYKPQIGEVGNANWLGGDKFEERPNATKAVMDNLSALKAAGADILPWKDQFQDHKLRHGVGFSKGDQYY